MPLRRPRDLAQEQGPNVWRCGEHHYRWNGQE